MITEYRALLKMYVLTLKTRDFFPGEGKIFEGGGRGGQKHTICLKTQKTYHFFSKKVHTILPSLADVHAQRVKSERNQSYKS